MASDSVNAVDAAGSVDNPYYRAIQSAAAYSRPSTAPDSGSTGSVDRTNETPQADQDQSKPQAVRVYFFDASLGQQVNILV